MFRKKPGKLYFFNTVTRSTSWSFPKVEEKQKPDKIKCSHILIKHRNVKNPNSKRTKKGVSKSRRDALEYIKNLEQILKVDKTRFSELAKKESDCSSFKRGGSLGFFEAKNMQKAFAIPAFALEIGELSGIVESMSGFHIILRVE